MPLNAELAKFSWLLAGTQFLLLLDTSIINVVLPTIAQNLGFNPQHQSWISNAYLIMFGSALLLSGRLADIYGKARLFKLGLWVLALGSLIAALALTPAMLISGRAIQGIGAAMAAAASFALVLSAFAGAERQKALGLLAAMAGAGGAAGTVLGGLLTELWDWRSTFWISVLGAALLLIWAKSILSTVADQRRPSRLDLRGAILLMTGQILLAYGLLNSDRLSSLAIIASAILLLWVFLKWQRSSPLLPSSIWAKRELIKANLLAATGQFVLFPMFLIVNLYLQNVLGYSPFHAGLALLPLCAVVILTAGQTPKIIKLLNLGKAISLGFALIALGLGSLSMLSWQGSFLADVLGPTLLIGLGLPLTTIASNILAGSHSEEGQEGLCSGLLNTAQQFGAVMGLAVLLGIATFHSNALDMAGRDFKDALNSGYSLALSTAAILALLAAAYSALALTKRSDVQNV